MSVIVGVAVTLVGWYVPFMYLGTAMFTVGCGLLHTLNVNTPSREWIGYQIIAGLGGGACIQLPFIAVQVVLDMKDMPTGNAIAVFFQLLGGAISISIAQNIFTNTIVEEVPKHTTSIDPRVIVSVGATALRHFIPKNDLPGVLIAYAYAIQKTFILPICVGAMAFAISFLCEWKSVKGKNLLAGAAGG